ncbi:hypothetical protein Ancab_007806 [Ancistrocladus abbreviatus]
MKKSGIIAASVAAATAARATTSSTVSINTKSQSPSHQEDGSRKERVDSSASSAERDKFAPRFDGLRFIETLITAHR